MTICRVQNDLSPRLNIFDHLSQSHRYFSRPSLCGILLLTPLTNFEAPSRVPSQRLLFRRRQDGETDLRIDAKLRHSDKTEVWSQRLTPASSASDGMAGDVHPHTCVLLFSGVDLQYIPLHYCRYRASPIVSSSRKSVLLRRSTMCFLWTIGLQRHSIVS